MSVNAAYVQWLVQWIQNGTINIATGKPFTVDDIKNTDYKAAVEAMLNPTQTTTQ